MKQFLSSATFICALSVALLLTACVSREERDWRRHLQSLADQTSRRGDICPVHHTAMTVKTVKMEYGLIVFTSPQPTSEVRQRRFPNATEAVLAGCIVSDAYPKTASVYHCPDCLRARAAWYAAHPKTK